MTGFLGRPVVIEAAKNLQTGVIHFRFTCNACQVEGAWHESLNDAELNGQRHNRMKHAVQVTA